MRAGLAASTVTPGRTPPVLSFTAPAMPLSWATAGAAATRRTIAKHTPLSLICRTSSDVTCRRFVTLTFDQSTPGSPPWNDADSRAAGWAPGDRLAEPGFSRRPGDSSRRMRIWSLHPEYLDARGLVALWREALLAQDGAAGRDPRLPPPPPAGEVSPPANPPSASSPSICDTCTRRRWLAATGSTATSSARWPHVAGFRSRAASSSTSGRT